MILFLCKLAHEPVHNFFRKRSKIKIVLKKRGAFIYLLSLSIIIDIDIDRGYFDTTQTRMVERFLKLKATKKWGLHNQKVGFAQPKSGVVILRGKV